MRRFVCLMTALMALLVVAPVGVGVAHAADPAAESAMTAAHNQLRASRGLPALGVHPLLVAKAQAWAANMAARNTLYHSNLTDGINVSWSKLGENVGVGPSWNGIFDAFVNSPEHFANMTDAAYQWIGVGVAYGGGRMWIAVEFMNGAAPPPLPPPPPPPPQRRSVALNPHGGYYVLRGDGHVQAAGGATSYGQASFGFDIARGLVVMPDGLGYAIVDGFGGLHRFGSATHLLPMPAGYWKGWDIIRGIAITGTGRGVVTLDAFGGTHAAGDAPHLLAGYWRGWDIARSVAISPDRRGLYVLDGWGGVHVAGTARSHGSPYWRGWDIARALTLTADGGGYAVLDGFGGIHAQGDARAPRATPYVRLDVWRGLAGNAGGYLVTRADGYTVGA